MIEEGGSMGHVIRDRKIDGGGGFIPRGMNDVKVSNASFKINS